MPLIMCSSYFTPFLVIDGFKIFEMITFFLVLLLLTIVSNSILMVRNYQVFTYRKRLLDMCKDYDDKHLIKESSSQKNSAFVWCLSQLPNYCHMLISFKPLVDDFWLPQKIKNKLLTS